MEAKGWIEADLGELDQANLPPDSGAVLVEESQQAPREVSRASSQCKRWRNQAAAVERSWEYLARAPLAHGASAERIEPRGQARVPTATTPGAIGATRSGISRVAPRLAALEGRKKVVDPLADCARERIRGPWAGPVDMPPDARRLSISRGQSTANQSRSHRSWGRWSLRTPRDPALRAVPVPVPARRSTAACPVGGDWAVWCVGMAIQLVTRVKLSLRRLRRRWRWCSTSLWSRLPPR